MVKVMNISKILINFTLLVCILIIVCPTAYKVIKTNEQNRIVVTEKYLIESAKKCIYEEKCKSNKITLKELYNYKYVEDEIFDPITKEVYSHESYIVISKNNSKFYPM